MPSKRKKFEVALGVAGVEIPSELLDQLVQGPMTPEEVQAICLGFKKALIERATGGRAEPSPRVPPRGSRPGRQL